MRLPGWGFPILLTAFIAWPLASPLLALANQPAAFATWFESHRLLTLIASSAGLVLGTVIIAVPLGVLGAIAIERGSPYGGNALRMLIAIGVFVPLPVFATAWQTVFASLGKLTTGPDPIAVGWRPWQEGLPPAIWVHGMAGLPWAIAIASIALRTTDRKLEDDARLTGGPWAVYRFVLAPRLATAAIAAAACVAIQAWTSITVTDTMIVRTFAEEVYTQIVGGPDGVTGAVAVAVPVWAVSAVLGVWLARRFAAAAPASGERLPPRMRQVPSWLRLAMTIALWAGMAVLVGVPLGTLIAKAAKPDASLSMLLGRIGRVFGAHGETLADSLLWSCVAGFAATLLAWFACERAMRSRSASVFVLALAAIAWVTPGPILGFGMKQVIEQLLTLEDAVLNAMDLAPSFPPMRSALYDQPSPLPSMWVCVVRFFPIAVAILWPAFRQVPRELLDLAKLDGGPGWQRLAVTWPQTRDAFTRAFLAASVLSLGELDAGKLVQPPGRQSFVQELFNAMHYGPDATVAAMTLLQIAATLLVCLLFLIPTLFAARARNG